MRKRTPYIAAILWMASLGPLGAYAKAPIPSRKGVLLKGRVLEKGRREPVEGAAVFIRALRRSVYTNNKGQYKLRVPKGTHKVTIKSIGYLDRSYTLKLKGPLQKDLYIEPDPRSSFRSEVREKRVKKSSQQFRASRELMQSAPGLLGGDPFRFFQNLPGVARAARTSGSLIVRGADFADTGFFIDGHRIPILYHFGAGLSVVSRRFLESIDFYPGGAPLRFGRITGGVVSANSRTPTGTGVHGEVYVSIANAGAYLEIPIGKHWSIAAAASRSYIDAFYSLLTSDPLVGAFWDYQFKVAYTTKKHQFSVFVFGSDDFYDYAGIQNGPEIPLIGRDQVIRGLRFMRMITKYAYQDGPWRIRTSLAWGFTQNLLDQPAQKDETWDWPIELRVDAQVKLHKQVGLSFGLDGIWNYQVNDFRLPVGETAGFPKPDQEILQQTQQTQKGLLSPALYASVLWRPFKGTRLRLGVRGELTSFQDRIQLTADPRLSASVQFHPSWRGLLSVGLYHRPPQPNEWSTERGNPDLGPQRAFQVASGLAYTYKRFVNVRAQFFYSQMFDLVTPSNRVIDKGGVLQPERFNNSGFGRAYGLELLLRFLIAKRFSGWVAYTLSRAERGQGPDETYSLFAFDQTHIFNLMLNWNIGAGWRLSARFRLATGNPTPTLKRVVYDADTDDYRPIFGGNDQERLPLFHQLDLRLDKTFTFDTWKLGFYLDILNVYNAKVAEEYRYNYNYQRRDPVQGLPFFPALGIRGEF